MFELKLPTYGMGMQDGTVLRWFKREGQRIEQGEPLLEIEAAKATVEIPAPCTGTLARILVVENDNVPIQTVLALIDDGSGEAVVSSAKKTVDESVPLATALTRNATLAAAVEPRARRLAQEHGVDLAALSGTGPQCRITMEDVLAAVAKNSS